MTQPAGEQPDSAVIRNKGQLTLPQRVRRQLGLREGDSVLVTVADGQVALTPATRIPRDQLWFWSEEWQAGEHEVDQDLTAGTPGNVYKSDDEFLSALARGVDSPDAR